MSSEIFDQLWRYTRWANETVFGLFDKYGSQLPPSSLRLMSHVMNAQATWLSRIDGKPQPVGIWDEHDAGTCKRMNAETLQGFRKVIDGDADAFKTIVVYKNSAGVQFETSIRDILLQMFNHGTYHRAQIAQDLRQKGLEPVNTDYIVFMRVGG
jgi:uncharacterized damage-inducible protein DinB